MEAVNVKGLRFTYPNAAAPALDGVDLTVREGEIAVLCGCSGSGKTTLLRLLKPELSPHGETAGEIALFGQPKAALSQRDSAAGIGFLLQDPEYQTVTHTVRSELAFGPENLGLPPETVRLRVAELAAYFSLEGILDRRVSALSGGQKQLLCLASVCVLHPKLLLLDEPTAQLDPAAGTLLLDTVRRLCRENGVTVILSEQRLENVIPMADRVIVLENGRVRWNCPPRELPAAAVNENVFLRRSLPAPMRIFAALGREAPLPVTVGEGRAALSSLCEGKRPPAVPFTPPALSDEAAVEMKRVGYSYDGESWVLRDLDLRIPRGSFFALMGPNAAGKSTVLGLISGVLPCKKGTLRLFGKESKKYPAGVSGVAAMLPQRCEALFGGNSVEEDFLYSLSGAKLSRTEKAEKIARAADFFGLSALLKTHPYDLSGGELQRAALAMLLMKEPRLLLLDEPTKGIDNVFKERLARRLRALCDAGVTVVAVTHDTEFAARYCDAAALLFDGRVVSQGNVSAFFSRNYFYTTAANKLARDLLPGAVTEGQVTAVCRALQKS